MSNKAPAFQWYVNDYLRDTRILSIAAKGVWADCLNYMWYAPVRGQLTHTIEEFAKLFNCTVTEAQAAIRELLASHVCNGVTHSDGKITLENRRMKREAEDRKSANSRQKRYRDRLRRESDAQHSVTRDGRVTATSSPSSSSSDNTPPPDARARAGGADGDDPFVCMETETLEQIVTHGLSDAELDLLAVSVFRKTFTDYKHKIPPEVQKQIVDAKIRSPDVWQKTCADWVISGYSLKNVPGLLDRYQKDLRHKMKLVKDETIKRTDTKSRSHDGFNDKYIQDIAGTAEFIESVRSRKEG